MPGKRVRRSIAIAAIAAFSLVAFPSAGGAAALEPPGKRLFFGVSDTGNPADFGDFTRSVGKHPAVIQTFRSWGSDIPQTMKRWQTARARPMLHITTADNNTGVEVIDPRALAMGHGDGYLIRLNVLFWRKRMRAYIRPLGEPNRCRNVYSSYDCEGELRSDAHRPRWYRLAFRRFYVIVHGGGKRRQINARLKAAGLPPLRSRVAGLPKAPVALLWSTLPAGSPTVPQNRPRHFYPGSDYVDWVGTDFYSDNQDWKALSGLYRRFRDKPFALPEWGLVGSDDPAFVRRLLTWVDRHRRTKMLVYYQDFGTSNSYRLQNFPAGLAVVREWLKQRRVARYAPAPPRRPPPPAGGVSPRPRPRR